MSVRSLCNNSVDVLRFTRVSDNAGGWTRTSDLTYDDVPCRIIEVSATDAAIYLANKIEVTDKIFIPLDGTAYAILEDDVLVDGSNRYSVVGVRDIDKMGHHLEIEARRVRPSV